MSNGDSAQVAERSFTVFCTKKDDASSGTWIQEVTASTAEHAARRGREACAGAWSIDEDEVEVRGVAEGVVNILMWDDENCVIDEDDSES